MTHSRHVELKQMLEARREAIVDALQQRLRTLRDTDSVDMQRAPADLSDDSAPVDLDFALVEMQGQTLDHIAAALARLKNGDYGICRDCEEEIAGNRLRALPFAVRCRTCQEREERVQVRDRRTDQRRMPFAAMQ